MISLKRKTIFKWNKNQKRPVKEPSCWKSKEKSSTTNRDENVFTEIKIKGRAEICRMSHLAISPIDRLRLQVANLVPSISLHQHQSFKLNQRHSRLKNYSPKVILSCKFFKTIAFLLLRTLLLLWYIVVWKTVLGKEMHQHLPNLKCLEKRQWIFVGTADSLYIA